MSDEYIDEINAIREQMMEECGQNLKSLGQIIKQSQEQDPENLVEQSWRPKCACSWRTTFTPAS